MEEDTNHLYIFILLSLHPVAAVSNLTDCQSPAAEAALIKALRWEWSRRVSRGAVLRSAVWYVIQIKYVTEPRRCGLVILGAFVPGGPTLGSSVTALGPSPVGFPQKHQGLPDHNDEVPFGNIFYLYHTADRKTHASAHSPAPLSPDCQSPAAEAKLETAATPPPKRYYNNSQHGCGRLVVFILVLWKITR